MTLSHISKYNLSDGSGIAPMTFTALNLLSKTKSWGGGSNAGGWEKSTIKAYLNGRFYEALPMQMKQLIKKVHVDSSAGQNSTSLVDPKSECHIYIPAVIEVDPTKTSEPYVSEGTPVPYMTTNSSRIRTMYGSDEAMEYSTRSPYVYPYSSSTSSYLYYVASSGVVESKSGTSTARGLLIMFSI